VKIKKNSEYYNKRNKGGNEYLDKNRKNNRRKKTTRNSRNKWFI